MFPYRYWYQDDTTGRFSIYTAADNLSAAIFVFSLMGLFLGCAGLAIESWGWVTGGLIGGLGSALIAFVLFALAVERVWLRLLIAGFTTWAFVALVLPSLVS